MTSERKDIIDLATRSVKWAWLASSLPRLFTPLATIILAALLSPADFGVVAISTIVISFSQVIVGFGLSPAIIQQREDIEEAASGAFWVSLLIASLLYSTLAALAPNIANFYRDPLVTPVIRVAGLSLILNAFKSIPSALLQRDLKFQKLFWIETIPQILAVAISITLAVLRGGVWALVIGPLVGIATSTGLTWINVRWRPALHVDMKKILPVYRFGAWMFVNGIMTWLFLYADNAIAGYYFGSTGLGVYSLGFNISNLLPAMIVAPLSVVVYPAFSALQNDRPAIGRDLVSIQSLTAAILMPAAFGLSAIAAPLISLLYGERWLGLGLVISMLAIMPGISHLWSFNADAVRAIGHPDAYATINGIALLILIPALLVTGLMGFPAFTLARFLGAFIVPALCILLTRRFFGVSASEQSKGFSVPLVYATGMYALAVGMIRTFSPFVGGVGWLKLILVVLACAGFYTAAIGLTRRRLMSQIILAGRKVFVR